MAVNVAGRGRPGRGIQKVVWEVAQKGTRAELGDPGGWICSSRGWLTQTTLGSHNFFV